MQTILIVLHVFLSAGLIALILMQHGKGADAGAAFGSGASATVFGSQGSANFLSRTTAVLATLFFVTSLALGYFSMQAGHKSGGIMEGMGDGPSGMMSEEPAIPGVTQIPVAPEPAEESVDAPLPMDSVPVPETSELPDRESSLPEVDSPMDGGSAGSVPTPDELPREMSAAQSVPESPVATGDLVGEGAADSAEDGAAVSSGPSVPPQVADETGGVPESNQGAAGIEERVEVVDTMASLVAEPSAVADQTKAVSGHSGDVTAE
jgi:preprotein translocase subunit SecG